MAVRASVQDVENILDTDLRPISVMVFIKSANRIITSHLGSDTTLSNEQKKDIETFLAAHFISMTLERQPIEEKVGDTAVKYLKLEGMNLDSTSYGQMVKTLDTTGKLVLMVGKKNVTMFAIESFDS